MVEWLKNKNELQVTLPPPIAFKNLTIIQSDF